MTPDHRAGPRPGMPPLAGPEEALRWGILGAGSIARKFSEALGYAASGSLAAVASRRAEAAQAFAAEFAGSAPGVRAHAGYDALLADDGVDAVYVATIHPTHAELAIAALRAGKHVLCEKPMTMTAAEAGSVFEAARTAEVFCMEGFMYLLNPLWERVLGLVREGAVGGVRTIEASFGFANEPGRERPRLSKAELGGGAVLDIGCYPVTAIRSIAGACGLIDDEPDAVLAAGDVTRGAGPVDEVTTAVLGFGGRVFGQASCSIRSWLPNRVVVCGDEAIMEIDHPWHGCGHAGGSAEIVVRKPSKFGGVIRRHTVSTDRWLFAIEADHVADCVAAGLAESPVVTHADTMATMRTIDRWLAAICVREDGSGR